MHIKDLSIDQLKALAYDTLAQIELNQKNLTLLNQEIAQRSQQTEKVVEEIKSKKK